MRFSVLLPTRNGGAYLSDCIQSVLAQDHKSFELVVSDNANTDDTPTVLAEFAGDARLRVVRQAAAISVSENWNAALHASTGEYILMLGDDDYLLPNTLNRLDEVLRRHDDPECVLFNGYSYVAPGSIGTDHISYWSRQHYSYGDDFAGEGVLTREHRRELVVDMFRFRQRVPLNMQTTLFARRAIDLETGGRFQAPFPDHYLINALLLRADRWVYLPEQLVVVGVSPKSFGHFFYSQQAATGLSYLGIRTDFPNALPGSELLNGTYCWLLNLKRNYPIDLQGVRVDEGAYVRRQVYAWFMQHRYGGISTGELFKRFAMLSPHRWLHLGGSAVDADSWRRLCRTLSWGARSQAQMLWHGLTPLPAVTNIREFANWVRDNAA